MTNEWSTVTVSAGSPPTPRHSHSAVVYKDGMYVFGGYDGSYRSDFHCFNFLTRSWSQVPAVGAIPRARYRGTCVVSGDLMILHGGHDGSRHQQDTHVFDFNTNTWCALVTEGPVPSPRDSHIAVVYGKSMYLYGGSTGNAMGDFHELKLEFRRIWSPVQTSMMLQPGSNGNTSTGSNNSSTSSSIGSRMAINSASSRERGISGEATDLSTIGITPGPRFCHVGVVYDGSLYIFGGYDGSSRLNDFLRYRFDQLDEESVAITSPTLVKPSSIRKEENIPFT